MIDPATGWIEFCTAPYARADLVSKRYPQPSKVIVDRGNEFFMESKTMIQADYGITVKPITSSNPQANSILERVHQTIGNIIRTFKVQDIVLDDENP